MPDPDPTTQPALRELALMAAWTGALLLSAANYLANHASGRPIRRVAYTLIVVLVCGTMIPAVALGALIRSRVVEVSVIEAAMFELVAAMLVGLALLAAFLYRQPREVWRDVPALAIALFAPSVAEVLVFAGLVQSVTEHALAIVAQPIFAVAAAVLVSSVAFALYHLTHGPPWNRWPMIRTLFVVWLAVAATHARCHASARAAAGGESRPGSGCRAGSRWAGGMDGEVNGPAVGRLPAVGAIS